MNDIEKIKEMFNRAGIGYQELAISSPAKNETNVEIYVGYIIFHFNGKTGNLEDIEDCMNVSDYCM